MSPERTGSPLGLEPRELALALQSAVPPFKLVRLQLEDHIPPQQASLVAAAAATNTVIKQQTQNDDDLTSLTWLQDNNLLKGMNLSCAKSESDEIQKTTSPDDDSIPQIRQNYSEQQQSPTSDYQDESSISEPTDSSSSSSLNSPIPYNNNNNQTVVNSPNSKTSSSATTTNKHPHNVKYDPMVHTFSKPPYSFSCLIFMAIEDSPLKALPVKDIYAWILDHFPYFKNAPTGWKNSVRHNLSLNKCFQKVEKSPSLGKGSLWMVDQQYRPNLLQALTRSPFHPCSTLDPATFRSNRQTASSSNSPFVQQMIDNSKTCTRLPNPELFPYLSRRLAASEPTVKQPPPVQIKQEPLDEDDDDESNLDDVHAATAILALKHGGFNRISPAEMVQVITRSPSEDHTYSSATGQQRRCASPDEAFESDEDNSKNIEEDEQRRIEEGADALLNLAGISTKLISNNENNHRLHNTPSLPPADDEFTELDENCNNQEKLTKFRPRLLRIKRKLTTAKAPSDCVNQSKRKFLNNNTISNKIGVKMTASIGGDGDDNENWANRSKTDEDILLR